MKNRRSVFALGLLTTLLYTVSCDFGCDDNVCIANRETSVLLKNYEESYEVVEYLNEYAGAAPGMAKLSTFINWGLRNDDAFFEILNSDAMQQDLLERIAWSIKDGGNFVDYMKLLEKKDQQKNEIELKSLLRDYD